jgi:hypothetical protein
VSDAHATRKLLEATQDMIVLGFHLDDAASEFELVCESPDTIAGASRAFVQFRFSGVQRFKRSPRGRYGAPVQLGTTFVAREVAGTWDVKSVHTAKPGTRGVLALELGAAYCGIEFEYETVAYEHVQFYAIRTESNGWTYFEVGTDRPVDFYNPFGCAWAEAAR